MNPKKRKEFFLADMFEEKSGDAFQSLFRISATNESIAARKERETVFLDDRESSQWAEKIFHAVLGEI